MASTLFFFIFPQRFTYIAKGEEAWNIFFILHMSTLTYNHFPKVRHAKYAAARFSPPDTLNDSTHTSADVHQTHLMITSGWNTLIDVIFLFLRLSKQLTHTNTHFVKDRSCLSVENPHHQLVIKEGWMTKQTPVRGEGLGWMSGRWDTSVGMSSSSCKNINAENYLLMYLEQLQKLPGSKFTHWSQTLVTW